MDRDELIAALDDELDTDRFNDVETAKLNGVLVEGRDEVETVALCTNVTFETIALADGHGADLVISHHGGWAEFDQDLHDEKLERMRDAGLTWYVAHEPLDCADDYGVSVALAEKLGVDIADSFGEHAGGEVGRYGTLGVSGEEFKRRLSEIDDWTVVDETGRHDGDTFIADDATVAVVGGGGGVFTALIREAAELGCDVYVTGNSTFYGDYYAHEKGITLVTLEETSSEKWGVHALGEELAARFDIDTLRLAEEDW